MYVCMNYALSGSRGGSGGGGHKTISATPRQLESLIRLSQVHTYIHSAYIHTYSN